MKLYPQRHMGRPSAWKLGLGLILTFSIGSRSLRASPQADRSAWILDDPSLARPERPLVGPARAHDEPQLWSEIWARARQEGALLGPKLTDQLNQANRHELELCLIAALGLSGGPSARLELTRVLDQEKTSDRILASFAYIQDRVAADKARMLRSLDRGKKVQALFLAGRLSLLASPWPIEAEEFVGRARSPAIVRIRPLLNALLLARNPKIEAEGLALPEFSKKVPPAGSLADHGERALLILACSRPGLVSREQLLSLLGRPPAARHFALGSLALGRLDKTAQTLPDLGNLVSPFYLLGLESCSNELQTVLLQGPGPAHPLPWQAWHWCAAVQHLSGKQWESILPELLAAESEVGDLAILALCYRLLVRGETLPRSESLKKLLEDPVAPDASPYRSILAFLTNPVPTVPAAHRKALGSVRTYALESWRAGRIVGDASVAGAELWKLLQSVEWPRPHKGPGSFEAALLDELNDLVWDLLILGSSWVERTQPGLDRMDRFLPEGVRKTDESYFRVLDAYLHVYPLFRSW